MCSLQLYLSMQTMRLRLSSWHDVGSGSFCEMKSEVNEQRINSGTLSSLVNDNFNTFTVCAEFPIDCFISGANDYYLTMMLPVNHTPRIIIKN